MPSAGNCSTVKLTPRPRPASLIRAWSVSYTHLDVYKRQVLWAAGLAPFAPFSLAATAPFGVPAVISLAFWGGIWGILFAALDSRFPPDGGYWLAAFLFGALAPSLVAWLVVLLSLIHI